MIAEIHQSEIDGIPLFSHPTSGTRIAGLVFRTGRAAESLHTSGVTHLVEHLALADIAGATYSYNGFVDLLRTCFVVSGSDQEIVEFFSAVCASLAELPEERIDKERTVLLTEEARTGGSPVGELYAARFGARGFGLAGFKQLGLRRLDPTEVSDWARDRFSRENAVLWVSGDVPARLELDLRSAEVAPMPTPEPTPSLALPRYIPSPTSSVTVGAMVRRSAAARAAEAVAVRRLQHRLRKERAITYDVAAMYEPLDQMYSHLSIAADALEEHSKDVAETLLETLQGLQRDGATEDELADQVTRLTTELRRPEATAGLVDGIATSNLFGWAQPLPEQLIREASQVTPVDVSAAAEELLESMLMLGPDQARPSNLQLIEDTKDRPVRGRVYTVSYRLPWKTTAKVILADDAISVINDGCTTIRFADVAAVAQHAEGLHVIGSSGETISLKPHLLKSGGDLMFRLQTAIPRDRFIPFDPSAENYHQVELAVHRDLPRRWVVADELALLRDLVDPTEKIELLAEANTGMRSGLFAVTERRVLFLATALRANKEPKIVELPRENTTVAKVTGSKVELKATDGTSLKVDEFSPPERLGQAVAALGGKPPRTIFNDAVITMLFALAGFGLAIEGSRWTGAMFCLLAFVRAWLGSGMGANVTPTSRRWMNRTAAALSVAGLTVFIARALMS